MSAVGIDFGNDTCYVAVARAGGLETVANDYSQRATPSYVAFGPTSRDLGTSAKNKAITNLKNTVSGFKRLVGKRFQDRTLKHEQSYSPYTFQELPNGNVGVKVSYLGKDAIFTIQQIAAMLLTKLKDITETACQSKVIDCVISVPIFFTDAERRAMLDVCRIANLNVLRLMNEPTAVALTYGFYRQGLSDSKPQKVVFVDMGHSAIQASVCEFFQGKLRVICSTWDYCVGGRDIDNCMECEKLKKQLSANPQVLPLNIECFMEDKDVNSCMGREKLEELCADLFKRIEAVLKNLLIEANLPLNEINAVELVGGSTRIPAVKNIIKKVFGMEPSTTLNQDEAVARGCALQAAMLSPNVKVKEFSIMDVQPFSIQLVWVISKNERGDIEAFKRNHPVPFSKLLTFFRKEDFTLDAYYASNANDSEFFIGSFTIKNVNQGQSGESAKIIVKLRVNIHGIFSVCSAVIADKDAKENANLDQKSEDLMDMKAKNCDGPSEPIVNEEKKTFFSLKKHKKIPQEIELQIEPKVPQLSESEVKTFMETELRMICQDSSEEKRINAKNSLEEYVYELRNRLSDDLNQYLDGPEYDNIVIKLNQTEEWIYEEEQNEATYKERLSELKLMADPILSRKFEHEQRLAVIAEFQNIISELKNILAAYLSGDPRYAHIPAKDMEQVQRILDQNEGWLQQQIKDYMELKVHLSPPNLSELLYNQKEKLKEEVFPILNQPKPQVEEPASTPAEAPPQNDVQC
ncbi:hypothetical protein JTE90_000709 [Oedothorax gibbosus]|uniref:Heat shock 70 kDa protein 4L n=1 Tax=Oedothorax gibbosus TaxID=931172 RepID=A0AAV6UQ70_9ARAC|nr:hypothetical protein JTE90_000709 [Oedothorax gibbosus]